MTDLTGAQSSTFADGLAAAQARVDLQNAQGGIDGRKIVLVPADDQSTPTGFTAAAQDLVSEKGVFGVVSYSGFTFAGAKYLQQHGVPVTGDAFDGPEWAQDPNSNMFSYLPPINSSIGGAYYNYDYWGKFLQQIGVTKLAGLAYGISPSSQDSIKATFASAALHGISKCYANYSVPVGGVDFTADALAIKSSGCDGVVGSFVDSSDVGLSTAVEQGGINAKQLYFTGYDQNTLATPAATRAFEGNYFSNNILWDTSNPAVAQMFSALEKYDSSYKAGSLPDFGLYGSYISTDLMIKGLQEAGTNPTRQSFIANLRKITNYTASGLLPGPTSFAGFGTPAMIPQTGCTYFLQLKNGKFVVASPDGKATCANRITYKP